MEKNVIINTEESCVFFSQFYKCSVWQNFKLRIGKNEITRKKYVKLSVKKILGNAT